MNDRAYRVAKRGLDLLGAGAGLVCFAPVLAGLVAANSWIHGWPPVFTQRRPGYKARVFTLVKLRTMTNRTGPDGRLLPDAERLTKFGAWLRASSLDELPELWNVLTGDMSLVGPRPLLVQYLERYSSEQARRHEVKPGLTGWAQVNGRNAIGWEQKLALDVWYVDHASFWLDLEILLRTVASVLTRRNINAAGEATMPEFLGNLAQRSAVEAASEATLPESLA
jgi:lipopolysaccharide/colanic/teichoic acid biosynthesis glycosyltransferase